MTQNQNKKVRRDYKSATAHPYLNSDEDNANDQGKNKRK